MAKSKRNHTIKLASVRGVSQQVVDTLKSAMALEGITSLSDGAAIKWGATQFAKVLAANIRSVSKSA